MKHLIALAAATVIMTGCAAHNVVPVAPPPPPSDMAVNPYRSLPPLPTPMPTEVKLPTVHVLVDNQPTGPIQCGELSVHVGKFDVNMPQGGTLEVAGVKGTTKAYHILLEDVTFTHKENCFR